MTQVYVNGAGLTVLTVLYKSPSEREAAIAQHVKLGAVIEHDATIHYIDGGPHIRALTVVYPHSAATHVVIREAPVDLVADAIAS